LCVTGLGPQIGEQNEARDISVLQHLVKFPRFEVQNGERTQLIIGARNRIREM